MKKLHLTVYILFFSTAIFCQVSKQIYESPNLKTAIKTHKKIAVLPVHVTISYKKMPKNYDAELNKTEQEKQGISIQTAMYTYILRKTNDFTVTCQDPETTNILLKKAGLTNDLSEIMKDSICKLLKVDAVISSTYNYEKTGSEAGAIAKSLLFGAAAGGVASGLLTMQIYNGTDGEMLWRFTKEMNETAFSSANEMVERLMRKVTRNFPYEK